jgi:hypothetical protein
MVAVAAGAPAKQARSAAQGRQASGAISSSALKPARVMRQRLSAPPTRAASQIPAAIRCAASITARALEAQAVETVKAGPSSSSAAPRKAGSELIAWLCA